jgi:hypothetical protein
MAGRRATQLAALVGALGIVSTGGLAFAGAQIIGNANGGVEVVAVEPGEVIARRTIPTTEAMLLVQIGSPVEEGASPVAGLTVLSLSPMRDGVRRGGYVIDIPTDVIVERPDLTAGSLGSLLTAGGSDAQPAGLESLQSGVENLLDIALDGVQAISARQLADALAPVAPISLDLIDPVPNPDGGSRALFAPGLTEFDSDDLATLLTLPLVDESDGSRSQRRALLWRNILDRAATMPEVKVEGGDFEPLISAYLPSLGAGPHETRPLTTIVTQQGTTPVKGIAEDATRVLMSQAMPDRVSVTGTRVWVISPLSDPTMMLDVAQIFGSGFVDVELVMLTLAPEGSPGFNGVGPLTRYLFSGEDGEAAGTALGDFLIRGRTEADQNPVEGIDLTIVLGKDFEDRILRDRAAAQAETRATTGERSGGRDANRPQDNEPIDGD